VAWEHFARTDHHTICPFKGEADYWTLVAGDPPLENVVWAYRTPLDEVAGLAGYVAFYPDRLAVELVEAFPSDPGHEVVHRVPPWGDAADLLRLLDVIPAGDGRFTSPSYPDPPVGTFSRSCGSAAAARDRGRSAARRGDRRSVEVDPRAARDAASMIFSRAARSTRTRDPVEALRRGRGYSAPRPGRSGGKPAASGRAVDAGAPDATAARRARRASRGLSHPTWA
jgi:hypothetical protein